MLVIWSCSHAKSVFGLVYMHGLYLVLFTCIVCIWSTSMVTSTANLNKNKV